MTKPRLRDVASLANVSEPTVSRVLNGKPGVATTTRERVIEALRQLGVDEIPEPRASRRGVVGIVAGDFTNPVFPTFVHHISAALARRGMLTSVVLADPDTNTEERCVKELQSCSVDAIVFMGGRHAEIDGDLDHYSDIVADGTPIVLINGRATTLDVPHIRCDERAATNKAVDHLVDLGHTRIGCLIGSEMYIPTHRIIDGFHQTLRRHGLSAPSSAVAHANFTFEGARAGAKRLLSSGITAIVAANDLMALGAIHSATSMGLEVPGELSVVGYDGTDLTAVTSPPLTTMRQPFEDMADLAAEAIVAELEGSDRYRDHYVFEPDLLSRSSSGRISPGLVQQASRVGNLS
ncbi:MAG: LacI family DNA-binding transcriptional regulator [Acidimicrobiales bacterium]